MANRADATTNYGIQEGDISFFRRSLRRWAEEHGRTFPWRTSRNPFHILLAELMLRRTRAAQVVPVFEEFIHRYPDPATLLGASDAAVKAALFPLGLIWRAPAFKQVARALLERHGGLVPDDPASLRLLPGVGGYVACAVLVFAFGRFAIPVDTNTVRVAARLGGISHHAESRRQSSMCAQVEKLIDPAAPAVSVLTLLDFAALVCRARNPLCGECPVAQRCQYARHHFAKESH